MSWASPGAVGGLIAGFLAGEVADGIFDDENNGGEE